MGTIGIIGAMEVEVASLKEQMKDNKILLANYAKIQQN